MANYITTFRLPDVVYHGTFLKAIPSIKQKIINFDFLKQSYNRDFGTGFYTTIDLKQAMRWPVLKVTKKLITGGKVEADEAPAVVKIRLHPERYDDDITVLDFRGESMEWVKFLLSHRLDSSAHRCSCLEDFGHPHPQIVCGSMADNDTGGIIEEFVRSGRSKDVLDDVIWFAEMITQDDNGEKLSALELGDQIAFFDERLNRIMSFEGYYTLRMEDYTLNLNVDEEISPEGWDYYGTNDDSNEQTYDA